MEEKHLIISEKGYIEKSPIYEMDYPVIIEEYSPLVKLLE